MFLIFIFSAGDEMEQWYRNIRNQVGRMKKKEEKDGPQSLTLRKAFIMKHAGYMRASIKTTEKVTKKKVSYNFLYFSS